MRLNYRQLTYIESAARHESMSNAAIELNVSKSSIASAVDRFEDEFSVTLFVRQPSKGLVLTSDGQRLVNEIRSLLQHTRQLVDEITGEPSQLAGEFSIACFAPLALLALPYVVTMLAERYPRLSIKIIEGDLAEVANLVVKGKADVALTYDLGLPDGVDFSGIASAPPYALMPPDHPLSNARAVALKELEALPMILLDLPESRTYFEMLFRVTNVRPKVAYRVTTFQTLRSFVSYGLGYAILNLKPASDITYTGKPIRCVPIRDDLPAPVFSILRRENGFHSAASELFSEVCVRFFDMPLGKQHLETSASRLR